MIEDDFGTDSTEEKIGLNHDSIRAYVSDLICCAASEGNFDAQAIIDANPEIRNHRSLVLDLVYEEYCRRKEAGEDVDQKSFLGKFPEYQHSLLQVIQVHDYLETSDSVADKKKIEWPVPGETFGDFFLVEQIGRGSFAHVFIAEEISAGRRRVVLKITRNASDEVTTLANLNHRNIVELYSVASDTEKDGFVGICMSLISQVTLFDVLVELHADRNKPLWKKDFVGVLEKCLLHRTSKESIEQISTELPPKKEMIDAVLQVGIDIADALEYSHRKGFLHCDIKPTNILITPEGHSMLFDFNLSAKSASKTGRIGGTLPYMPPEQLQALIESDFDFEMTPAADLFSFGVTIYQLLTGELPFGDIPDLPRKSDAAKIMLERQKKSKINLAQVKGINSSFRNLILRCLSFEPSQRPQSAESLAVDLRAEATIAKRSRRWVISHPVTTMIAAVILIGIFPGCQWLYQYSLGLNQQQFVSLIAEGKAAQSAREFPLAIQIFQEAIDRSEAYPKRQFLAKCFLTMAYAHAGKDGESRKMLEELKTYEDKEQRGRVAEILLASVGSRKKILADDTTSISNAEITLRNQRRFGADNLNNFSVINARCAGRHPTLFEDSMSQFKAILETAPQHCEANYNLFRFTWRCKPCSSCIGQLRIAINEKGPQLEYLTRLLAFDVGRFAEDESAQNLDQIANTLILMQKSDLPQTVLTSALSKHCLRPTPVRLKKIISKARSYEPVFDYVFLNGIADPLAEISIEAFLGE